MLPKQQNFKPSQILKDALPLLLGQLNQDLHSKEQPYSKEALQSLNLETLSTLVDKLYDLWTTTSTTSSSSSPSSFYNDDNNSSKKSLLLPFKLLKDVSPQGSLFRILRTTILFCAEHKIENCDDLASLVCSDSSSAAAAVITTTPIPTDATSTTYMTIKEEETQQQDEEDHQDKNGTHNTPDTNEKLNLLFDLIYQDLTERGFWKLPTLYMSDRMKPSTMTLIQNSASNMNLEIVDNIEEASHVLESNRFERPPEDQFRLVQRLNNHINSSTNNSMIEVHCIGKPDSHDFWKSDDGNYLDETENTQQFGVDSTPYFVSYEWLLDSEKFQEWMNEEDYIVSSSCLDRRRLDTASNTREQMDMALDGEDNDEEEDDDGDEDDPQDNDDNDDEENEDDDEDDDGDDDEYEEEKEEGDEVTGEVENQDKLADEYENLTKYPEIELVDLDKKIPARAKKYEFESFNDPRIFNISNIKYPEIIERSWQSTSTTNNLKSNETSDEAMDVEENHKEQQGEVSKMNDEMDIVEPEMRNHTTSFNSLETETGPQEKEHEIIVPVQGLWYSTDAIHPNERKILKDYFEPVEFHKSAESYQSIRNSIVTLYRKNPRQYLSVSTCIKMFDQPLKDMLRIHGLLEHFGLINYQVHSGLIEENTELPNIHTINTFFNRKTTKVIPICYYCSKEVESGIYYVTKRPLHYDLCMFCFIEGNYPSRLSSNDFYKVYIIWNNNNKSTNNNVTSGVNGTTNTNGSNINLNIQMNSNASSSNPYQTTYAKYGQLKKKDSQLINGLEGSGLSQLSLQEFLHNSNIENPQQNGTTNDDETYETAWTDEQVYKLLVYFELYGDDWDRIAQYIEGKSAEECVTKIVELDFLESLGEENIEDYEHHDRTPLYQLFERSENPLMNFLHVISNAVGESFAADAAKAALNELMNRNETLGDDEEDDGITVSVNKKQHVQVNGVNDAYCVAVDAVKLSVNQMIEDEESKVQDLCKDLISLQTKLCEKKLDLYKNLNELKRVEK